MKKLTKIYESLTSAERLKTSQDKIDRSELELLRKMNSKDPKIIKMISDLETKLGETENVDESKKKNRYSWTAIKGGYGVKDNTTERIVKKFFYSIGDESKKEAKAEALAHAKSLNHKK